MTSFLSSSKSMKSARLVKRTHTSEGSSSPLSSSKKYKFTKLLIVTKYEMMKYVQHMQQIGLQTCLGLSDTSIQKLKSFEFLHCM
jgi:hypothetical protein